MQPREGNFRNLHGNFESSARELISSLAEIRERVEIIVLFRWALAKGGSTHAFL
jgi:hypothetical protein